jgi:hypothetical protein
VAWVAVIGAASAQDVMDRVRLGRTVGYRRLRALVDHGLLSRSRLVLGAKSLRAATREALAWARTPARRCRLRRRSDAEASRGRSTAGAPLPRARHVAPRRPIVHLAAAGTSRPLTGSSCCSPMPHLPTVHGVGHNEARVCGPAIVWTGFAD